MLWIDETPARNLGARKTCSVPRGLSDGREIVEASCRDRVYLEESDDHVQHLPTEIFWEPFSNSRHSFGGGPANNSILVGKERLK